MNGSSKALANNVFLSKWLAQQYFPSPITVFIFFVVNEIDIYNSALNFRVFHEETSYVFSHQFRLLCFTQKYPCFCRQKVIKWNGFNMKMYYILSF